MNNYVLQRKDKTIMNVRKVKNKCLMYSLNINLNQPHFKDRSAAFNGRDAVA